MKSILIDNFYDALVLALKLAISAPTEEQAKRAIKDAQSFAENLSEIEVERAKNCLLYTSPSPRD